MKYDFILTPQHIERGLKSENWNIQEFYKRKQAELQAKWEEHELKKRHADVIEPQAKNSEAL